MQVVGSCDPYTAPAAVSQSLQTAGLLKCLTLKNT